ncbi:MAG: class I SAM-dependent methyltransferase [Vicinamibacterales bacterium]
MDPLEQTARAERTHFWFRGFRRFLAPVLAEQAAGRRDLRLLDCGCGTGVNLPLLRPYGQVYAFDLSAVGLRHAAAPGACLARASVLDIPFTDAAFDMVVSFDVLQSVPDAARAVREMGRVLRPGGTLVLSASALEILRGDHAEIWHEVRRYTPRSLGRLVEGAGLHVIRARFLFATLFPLLLANRLMQRMTRPFRRVAQDGEMDVPPAAVNEALVTALGWEAALARHLPMPVGSSVLVVARKPLA